MSGERAMRLRDCARLGVANAIAAWPRFLLLSVLAAAITTATAWAGPRAYQRHLVTAASMRRNGGSVLVARSQHGLDGSTCDRLARVTGIGRAGAVEPSPTLYAIRPGALASWWTMTPGFRTLVFDGDSRGSALVAMNGTAVGTAVGAALGTELALGPQSLVASPLGGTRPTPVGVVPDLGARTDAFTRSVLTVDARHRAYSQCWVETNGATVRAATALLTATFAVTNADVQVAPLVVDGAPEHHQPPSISFAWIACGALLGFANALFCFLRRLDSALFGLLGMTFRQRAVAIGTELMLADAFAAGAALLAVIGWLAGHGAFPRPALAASGEFFVASVALAGALTLVSVALVGTRQWFSVLREG